MSAPIVPGGSNLYSQGFGSTSSNNINSAIKATRAPATTDVRGPSGNYVIGQRWIDTVANSTYTLTSLTPSGNLITATWVTDGGGGGALSTLSGDTGTAVPTAGNIQIAGSGGVTTSAAGSIVTIDAVGGVEQFNADSGSATPAGDQLDIVGDLQQLITNGSTNVISIGFRPTLLADWGSALGGSDEFTSLGVSANTFTSGNASVTAIGFECLQSNTAPQNTAVGCQAAFLNNTGTGITAIGFEALETNSSGTNNTGVGAGCANAITTNSNLTAIGFHALEDATGGGNTGVGSGVGDTLVGGTNNTLLGFDAGSAYVGSESNNIIVGAAVAGTAAESNAIRIGNASNATCFITGIRGATTGQADAVAVLVDSANQLGTVSSSRRYKENIQDLSLTNSSRIYSLKPVSFKYKDQVSTRPQYGLIAEDVDEVMRDIVVYDEDGKPDTIQYQTLPIFLLKEIQNLRKEVDELKTRLKGK